MTDIPTTVKKFSRAKVVQQALAEDPPQPEAAPAPAPRGARRRKVAEAAPLPPPAAPDPAEDVFADLKNHEAEVAPPPPPPTETRVARPAGGKKRPVEVPGSFSDLFDEKAPPLLGKDKREVLTKMREMKALFPSELRSFKIAPNATVDQLRSALEEMDVLVTAQGVTKICDEAVLLAIGMCESLSARTSHFNITGTSAALRENPEFARICKIIWVRHKVLSAAPPEMQLVLIIGSTAIAQAQINRRKAEINGLLHREL